jgi:hypothetical protein
MQGNFAPVEEIGEIREISDIAGEIPADFPEGVYLRNGKPSILPSSSLIDEDHGAEFQLLPVPLVQCRFEPSLWSSPFIFF